MVLEHEGLEVVVQRALADCAPSPEGRAEVTHAFESATLPVGAVRGGELDTRWTTSTRPAARWSRRGRQHLLGVEAVCHPRIGGGDGDRPGQREL